MKTAGYYQYGMMVDQLKEGMDWAHTRLAASATDAPTGLAMSSSSTLGTECSLLAYSSWAHHASLYRLHM